MSYCTIDDVAREFPTFQRNADGSVSDDQIQTWIDRAAARIDAMLMQRGFDPQSPPGGVALTQRQTDWLAALNEDYAASKLAAVLEGVVSLQPGETSIAAQRRKAFEATLGDVRQGRYDAFFGLASRITDQNAFAGADTEPSTPQDRQENRSFGANQEF